MFESEMRIEVERRLQKACDDRARAGLPPPVSIDALRGIVRSDLIEEIEARRVAQKVVALKPAPAAPKPAVVSPPILTRQAAAPKPPTPPAAPKATGMALLLEMAARIDRSEPVFPSLRNPPRAPAPKPSADPGETAARAILEAGRIARNG